MTSLISYCTHLCWNRWRMIRWEFGGYLLASIRSGRSERTGRTIATTIIHRCVVCQIKAHSIRQKCNLGGSCYNTNKTEPAVQSSWAIKANRLHSIRPISLSFRLVGGRCLCLRCVSWTCIPYLVRNLQCLRICHRTWRGLGGARRVHR